MLPHANTNASLNFTNVSFAQQIGPTYRCLKPQGTQTNACLGEFSRLTSQKSSSQRSYNTLGVVNVVQLYLGLFVCANGRTGGSIRYHVSRTTVASCATDMAQYGILCKISWKPAWLLGGWPTSCRVQVSKLMPCDTISTLPPGKTQTTHSVGNFNLLSDCRMQLNGF